MERTTRTRRKLNWLLTAAAILFAALLVVLCLLLRPKAGALDRFVIHFANGETLEIPAWETKTIVIRDGRIVDSVTGEGDENVIRIENGRAWMEQANCPHHECVRQGALTAETVRSRPLGTWIVCAPHKVYVEFAGGGQ